MTADVTREALGARYRDYIACLNAQDWERLGAVVDADVVYNGQFVGLKGTGACSKATFAPSPISDSRSTC